MTLLSLRAGRLAVDLAPEAGGSIARFTIDDSIDVLRPASAEALASGRGNDTACYPLVPFSNRIADGHLAFDGQQVVLEPNWPGLRHPMHGDGWAHSWRVERSDARSAELSYGHDGRDGWPFRYRARQSYRLDGDAFSVGMSIENLESQAVPAGLGLHLFLRASPTPTSPATRATALAGCRSPADGARCRAGTMELRPSRPVDGVVLGNCFDGWDGRADTCGRAGKCVSTSRRANRFVILSSLFHSVNFFFVSSRESCQRAIADTRLAAGATLAGEIVLRLFHM